MVEIKLARDGRVDNSENQEVGKHVDSNFLSLSHVSTCEVSRCVICRWEHGVRIENCPSHEFFEESKEHV